MPTIALYAGSFDPITNGHTDLIRRSLGFVDRLVVAVAVNVAKQPLFTSEERVALIRRAVDDEPRVQVESFQGLLVDFARRMNVRMIIRGLRAVSDFEYEYQMALMNRHLASEMETVFMIPSSMVREIARFGGDVSSLVHPAVVDALRARFAKG
jgi:pantetheine-phosphate adenylyltransferase